MAGLLPKCPVCTRANSDRSEIETVFECARCGFSASTTDIVRADYLVNFYDLPAVSRIAQRIATGSPLQYGESKVYRLTG